MLHYTAMHSAQAALHRLCDPSAEVSAHYLIGRDGTLWQMVAEDQRAWHAGAGAWQGQDDINSRSIGIELDNRGDHPFAQPQMQVLETLLAQIMTRWQIPPSGVIGHSDMAPGRKSDPGARFDWARLERQRLAARPTPGPETDDLSAQHFRQRAQERGYPGDTPDAALLEAVRLRYRQGATGPLCAADFAALGEAQPALSVKTL